MPRPTLRLAPVTTATLPCNDPFIGWCSPPLYVKICPILAPNPKKTQETEMTARNFAGVAAAALGAILAATGAFAQTQPATHGPSEGGSPAWSLKGSFPDPGGNTVVDPDGRVTVPPRTAGAAQPATATAPSAPALPRTPSCSRSPVCGNRLT